LFRVECLPEKIFCVIIYSMITSDLSELEYVRGSYILPLFFFINKKSV
jgi:hypothetical protein